MPHLTPRTRSARLAAAATCMALLATVGCSSAKKDATPKPTVTTTTKPGRATTSSVPDPTIPKGAVTSPLTGLAPKETLSVFRPAIAVKIDNLDTRGETARPQAGIADADLVFEEIVEGNITRLVGVFQSAIPARVGPVRSARTTDPILLAQLDRPLLAWSGGNGYVVGAVHASPLHDVGYDAYSSAYGRDRSRRAPHNLFVTPGQLYAAAPDAKAPRPVFSYRATGEKLLPTAKVVHTVRVTFGGGAASPVVTYQYDPKVDGWRRGQNGTTHVDDLGTVVAPTNVVILFTNYVQSPADPKSPEAQTVGHGDAWLLSKGRVIGGTWERDSPTSHYVLKDSKGKILKLTPGKTWIELPRPGGATITG